MEVLTHVGRRGAGSRSLVGGYESFQLFDAVQNDMDLIRLAGVDHQELSVSRAQPGSLLDVLGGLAVGREPNVALGADVVNQLL